MNIDFLFKDANLQRQQVLIFPYSFATKRGKELKKINLGDLSLRRLAPRYDNWLLHQNINLNITTK